MATRREICQRWSDNHSHGEVSEYNPEWAEDYGYSQSEYTNAYYNAFIRDYKPGETLINENGDKVSAWHHNFHFYLVDVIGYCNDEEFQQYYYEPV